MKKFFEEFKKFIKRGNVVDMAVGVAVASAFTAIVNAFTKGFISPLLAMLTGESTLDELKWVIKPEVVEVVDGVETVTSAEVALLWGSFVHAIINFFIVALALFTVMKIVASVRARAEKIGKEVRNRFSNEDEKAAAEAERAKAEAEAAERAAAEAKAEEERLVKEAEEAERARLERQETLLSDIRDLLEDILAK
ncbi:MAG: MscL family protein [Clostridia bacterium]|nr:MscL family protein [Clostridia bacterium]